MITSKTRILVSLLTVLILVIVGACAFQQLDVQSIEQSITDVLVPGTNRIVRLETLNLSTAGARSSGMTNISAYSILSINGVSETTLAVDFFHVDTEGELLGTTTLSLYRHSQSVNMNGVVIPVFGNSEQLMQAQNMESALLLSFLIDVEGGSVTQSPEFINDKNTLRIVLLDGIFGFGCCGGGGITSLCGRDIVSGEWRLCGGCPI
ncbi:MAG: hypothetical protein FWC91_14715 [Defluviitaleaceae bacterium]|nr:hypothetical protein [Defluviitaleaceae bacterium]